MLLDAIRSLLGAQTRASPADNPVSAPTGIDPLHLAACALLLDVAHADGEFADSERRHLEDVLARHFALSPEAGRDLLELADRERRTAVDYFQFTSRLREGYDTGQKMVLAEVMWGLVVADGAVAEHEHYLTRKISHLLDLKPGYLAAAKSAVESRSSTARAEPGSLRRRSDDPG
jgi:uncharacterized tellurite resistance protein B-like protein